VHHANELMGHAVDVDFVLHDPGQVLSAFASAGLTDLEWYLRGPLDGEVQTDRLYVLARRA
jgi:NADPH-dependent ferric siderophore reductase